MSCPHGNPIGGCDTCDEVDAAFEAGKRSALAEQPAQQEQEPVAWIDEYGNAFPLAAKQYSVVGKHWKPLYTSTPAQEFVCSTGLCHYRKPLTDEQIESINVRLAGSRDLARLFARAIEAAHSIKENT